MSGKWPGGFITKLAPTVTGPTEGEGGSASGIWTLDQVADYEKQGLWPKLVTPKTQWGAGQNTYGQLGTGDTTIYSSPKQVGALTDWLSVSCGLYFTVAVKTDGTLWGMGWNAKGQYGTGDTTTYNSPVQVGGLSDWKAIGTGYASTVAVKTDGTLWGIGYNNNGQLGDETKTDRSSPVQVGALTDWDLVSAVWYQHHAIKTDGTLWTWGDGYDGGTWHGNVTDRSSPVQVGALTTWSKSSGCGKRAMMALKTDGTLWTGGGNTNGQLMQNNTTSVSSPVQVGSSTAWFGIAAGATAYFSFAIKKV